MFLEKLNHRKSLQLRLRNLNICIEKVQPKCWNSRDVVASSPSFSRPAASVPQRAASQAILPVQFLTFPNLLMITDIVYLLLPNDLILTYVNYILLWYYPTYMHVQGEEFHYGTDVSSPNLFTRAFGSYGCACLFALSPEH